ncbi:PolC-type DNA polymerase III [Paeniglutamicibacter gangotriensis]|uniref:PolC-type DNA polymerase III n=1 Tax=Paeniglutamicibacter gangotriensis TaxID=254787 RepID=UPI0037C8A5D5
MWGDLSMNADVFPRSVREQLLQPKFDVLGFVEGFATPEPNSVPLDACEFVVFDLETSGLEPEDRLVEIAAIRINGHGAILGSFASFVYQPQLTMSPGATRVNGISDDMLRDAPEYETVWPELRELFSGAIAVAHNAPFDVAMFNREHSSAYVGDRIPVLDTLWLARNALQTKWYSLDFLSDMLELEPVGPDHWAMADAFQTAQLLLTILNGPLPLYWHGDPVVLGISRDRKSAKPSTGRLEDQLPTVVSGCENRVGIELTPPAKISVDQMHLTGIRGKRFYPTGTSPDVLAAMSALLGQGAVQAKRHTKSSRAIIAESGTSPDFETFGVEIWTPSKVAVEISKAIKFQVKAVEDYNAWQASRHKRRSERVPHWRQKHLSPVEHASLFKYDRWTMNRPERVLNAVEDETLKAFFKHRMVESVWVLDTDRQDVQFWINFDEKIGALTKKLEKTVRKSMKDLVEWDFWEPTHYRLHQGVGILPDVRARRIK